MPFRCRSLATAVLALALPSVMCAQAPLLPGQQASGPVIQSTGMSFKVDDPTFTIPANHDFKAVFIISAGGADTAKVNEQVVSLARFYNATVRNGYPESHVHAAAVFHSNGWQAILTDAAFTARFGHANPSRQLVEELLQHGATLVLCGQTAGRAGVKKEEMIPGVKLAISAMTAFEFLQSQGYQYISW